MRSTRRGARACLKSATGQRPATSRAPRRPSRLLGQRQLVLLQGVAQPGRLVAGQPADVGLGEHHRQAVAVVVRLADAVDAERETLALGREPAPGRVRRARPWERRASSRRCSPTPAGSSTRTPAPGWRSRIPPSCR